MAVSPVPTQRLPLVRLTVLAVSVAVIAIGITWTYLGMRAVMDIGGACASGGPYVPVQPCPENESVLLSVGIPLLMLATLTGTVAAIFLRAPTPLLPMWAALFGSLGWNFLDYAFNATDSVVVGWLVCGIVFELMALPAAALWLVGGALRIPWVGSTRTEGTPSSWVMYAVAGAAGVVMGLWSFRAWTG